MNEDNLLLQLGFQRSDTSNIRWINFECNLILQMNKKSYTEQSNYDKMYVRTINGVPMKTDLIVDDWCYIPNDYELFGRVLNDLCEISKECIEVDGYKTGVVVRVEDKIKFSERFNKQTIVLDTDDTNFKKRISIDFVNTYINLLGGIEIGNSVMVYYVVSGKDIKENKNITTLQAVDLKKL